MTSGIKPSDEVKEIIQQMKIAPKDTLSRIRLVVLVIKEGFIVVERIFRQNEFQIDVDQNDLPDAFEAFIKQMDPTICRYLLYDCHYESSESPKEELIFASWCPDTCNVKEKMCYASTKGSMKSLMNGFKHDFQLSGLEDVTKDKFAEKLKDCISIEGKPIRGGSCKK